MERETGMSGKKHVHQVGTAGIHDENVFDLFQGRYPRHQVSRTEDSKAVESQIH